MHPLDILMQLRGMAPRPIITNQGYARRRRRMLTPEEMDQHVREQDIPYLQALGRQRALAREKAPLLDHYRHGSPVFSEDRNTAPVMAVLRLQMARAREAKRLAAMNPSARAAISEFDVSPWAR